MTEDTLDTLAAFNKLRLSSHERQTLYKELTQLLDALAPLSSADTSQTEPMIQVNPLGTVMREDTVIPMVSRAEILVNAPEHDQGYFLAPRVLE
ncbi:MAG: Asp-tRNA(Asn)/Glu-tRNA(Gln) amidotransferase subunit GatC [Peptococcaceae bacterium]|nr:Asp-tRNA(Asn)/Glu-tRNA(Gln) amidotransferase subunit GatC [Peptococcaceae bacterium]